jgi:hypothetical protein
MTPKEAATEKICLIASDIVVPVLSNMSIYYMYLGTFRKDDVLPFFLGCGNIL